MRGAQPVHTGYQGLTPRQQLREPGSEPHLQGGPSAGEPSATTAHPKTRRRQAQGPSHSLHAHPVFTRVHAHPHIHAHVRQFSNTLRTLVHSRGPAHSRLCSHLHAHTVMLMSHACAVSHVLTSRRIDSHPHTLTRTWTLPCILIHTHTRAHTLLHAPLHSHRPHVPLSHICLHTHTDVHTRSSHIHTHAYTRVR